MSASLKILAIGFLAWGAYWSWPVGAILLAGICLCWLVWDASSSLGKAVRETTVGLTLGIGLVCLLWLYLKLAVREPGNDAAVAQVERLLLQMHRWVKYFKKPFDFPWVFLTCFGLLLVQWFARREEIVSWAFEKVAKPISFIALIIFAAASFTFFGGGVIAGAGTRLAPNWDVELASADGDNRGMMLEAIAAGSLSRAVDKAANVQLGSAVTYSPETDRDLRFLVNLLTEANRYPGLQRETLISNIAVRALQDNRALAEKAAAEVLSEVQSTPNSPTPNVDNAPRNRQIRSQTIVALRESLVRSIAKLPSAILPGDAVPAQVVEKYAKKLVSSYAKEFLKPRITETNLARLQIVLQKQSVELPRLWYPAMPRFTQDFKKAASWTLGTMTCICEKVNQNGGTVSIEIIAQGKSCGGEICGLDSGPTKMKLPKMK